MRLFQLNKLTKEEIYLLTTYIPVNAVSLQYTAFQPAIALQASDAQLAKWMPDILSMRIRGAYA
jgi:hypothetical protein